MDKCLKEPLDQTTIEVLERSHTHLLGVSTVPFKLSNHFTELPRLLAVYINLYHYLMIQIRWRKAIIKPG